MRIPMSEHGVSYDRLQTLSAQHPTGRWVSSIGSLYYTVIVKIDNLEVDFTWFGSRDAVKAHELQHARDLVAAADAEDEEE